MRPTIAGLPSSLNPTAPAFPDRHACVAGTGYGQAVDVLFDGDACTTLAGPRIKTGNTHGTGCTTASAIAAELAKGASVPAAVRIAKGFVGRALAASAALRIGSGAQRPFNHGCAAGIG